MTVNNRLDGWKEISEYVGKSVKTVQRWEKENNFPIRRIIEKKSVFALKPEIDKWFKLRDQIQLKEKLPIKHEKSKNNKFNKFFLILIFTIFLSAIGYYYFSFLPNLKNRKLIAKVQNFSKGSTFQVTDQFNNNLLEFVSDNYKYQFYLSNTYNRTCYKFQDLNNDNIEDFVFTNCDRKSKENIKIFISDNFGNLKDKTKIKNVNFSYKNNETHLFNRITELEVADIDNDNQKEIIISQNSSPYYPNCTRAFKLSGEEIFRFLNPGHIQNVVVRDLDNNGKKELILAGCNNFLHKYSIPVFIKIESNWNFKNKTLDLINFEKGNCTIGKDIKIAYIFFPYIDLDIEKQLNSYQHSYILKAHSSNVEKQIQLITYPYKIIKKTIEGAEFVFFEQARLFFFRKSLKPEFSYFVDNFIELNKIQNRKELEEKYLKVYYYNGETWQDKPCYITKPFKKFKKLTSKK